MVGWSDTAATRMLQWMTDRHVRQWNALGLMFQLAALLLGVGVVVAVAGQAIQPTWMAPLSPRLAEVAPEQVLAAVVVQAAVALLLWRSRRALVRGRPRGVRLLGAVLFCLAVLGSAGLALVGFLVAYLVAGDPRQAAGEPPTAPSSWLGPLPPGFVPNAVVGSLDITGWVGPEAAHPRPLAAGTPVRVLEAREGYADVVAPDGWRAWVDIRMLQAPGAGLATSRPA